MNPITALSEQLQKLINEHGSASILRDHLALFKDKVALLEKSAAALEASNAKAVKECETLRAQVSDLKAENEALKNRLDQHERPDKDDLLDGTKAKILVCLAAEEASTADELAPTIGANLQIVKFHLDELYKAGIIDQEHNPFGANWWSLKQEGRRLLIVNGLIS